MNSWRLVSLVPSAEKEHCTSSGWPVTQEWHECRHRNTRAPFFHHRHLCLSQHLVIRILPCSVFVVTGQAKTPPVFCMSLGAPTASLQACQASQYVTRQLQNKSLFLEYNGIKRWKKNPILNNSAENVLPPGFLLCQHKLFWHCLASYQGAGSPGPSALPASDIQNKPWKTLNFITEQQIIILELPLLSFLGILKRYLSYRRYPEKF